VFKGVDDLSHFSVGEQNQYELSSLNMQEGWEKQYLKDFGITQSVTADF